MHTHLQRARISRTLGWVCSLALSISGSARANCGMDVQYAEDDADLPAASRP